MKVLQGCIVQKSIIDTVVTFNSRTSRLVVLEQLVNSLPDTPDQNSYILKISLAVRPRACRHIYAQVTR